MLAEGNDQRLRQLRPPYVAFKTFDQFLRKAAAEEVPSRIDAACLGRWRIAGGNESALVTSLKSLGLIDAEGRPTADYREIRLSIPRRNASLRRCARRAYVGLDGAIDQVVDDDRLRDYFIADRGLLGQMVEKAVRYYRHLEELLASSKLPSDQEEPSARSAPEPVTTATSLPALSMCVEIPFDASDADLVAFFKRLKRAWHQADDSKGDQFQ